MERLNTLLAQMQSEDTTLADSVKLYAEAASLMEYCHAALEKTSAMLQQYWRFLTAACCAAGSAVRMRAKAMWVST